MTWIQNGAILFKLKYFELIRVIDIVFCLKCHLILEGEAWVFLFNNPQPSHPVAVRGSSLCKFTYVSKNTKYIQLLKLKMAYPTFCEVWNNKTIIKFWP